MGIYGSQKLTNRLQDRDVKNVRHMSINWIQSYLSLWLFNTTTLPSSWFAGFPNTTTASITNKKITNFISMLPVDTRKKYIGYLLFVWSQAQDVNGEGLCVGLETHHVKKLLVFQRNINKPWKVPKRLQELRQVKRDRWLVDIFWGFDRFLFFLFCVLKLMRILKK